VLDGSFDPPTARGSAFNAAFAKLLWPFVVFFFEQFDADLFAPA